jgi:hypothetical protein
MLKIHFLNVKNGDCIILEYHPKSQPEPVFGIIDCNAAGFPQSPGLRKLKELGAKRLAFVCITHPDKDHYSGVFDILQHYEGKIDAFYTCPLGDIVQHPERIKKLAGQYLLLTSKQDDAEVTARALEFVQILQYAHQKFLPIDAWEELTGYMNAIAPPGFLGVEVHCLQPPKLAKGRYFEQIKAGTVAIESQIDHNALSIAFLVRFAGRQVILAGDATAENWRLHRRWQDRGGFDIRSDAVKLPHHGSARDCNNDTIDNFFKAHALTLAIISADGKRHPAAPVLEHLQTLGVRPYCTNYFHGWGQAAIELFTDPAHDPELIRLLSELSRIDLGVIQPCKGDITLEIADTGDLAVYTEHNHACLCDPSFGDLLDAL